MTLSKDFEAIDLIALTNPRRSEHHTGMRGPALAQNILEQKAGQVAQTPPIVSTPGTITLMSKRSKGTQ
jgi:hypothetical protein